MQCRCPLFLSLMLFVGLSYAQTTQPKPPLTLSLSANNVIAGEQLIANCTAQTNTANRVLYINDQPVTTLISGDRVSSTSLGMTTRWIIDPVLREDAGEYYCFAGTQSETDTDSPPQNVTVYFPPNVTVVMSPDSVLSGQPATVVVFVDALPGITGVQFIPPNESAGDPMHSAAGVTFGTVTLTFPSVNRYYNGKFTAQFTNDVGSDTVDFELTVFFGPHFSYEGEEQMDGASIVERYVVGQEVILVCDVSASNPVVSSLNLTRPSGSNVDFDEGTGTITISRATAADEGTYTCTADNGETTPTTINFDLRMDMSPPNETTEPSTDGAGNLLANVSVAVVMLLATIFLS